MWMKMNLRNNNNVSVTLVSPRLLLLSLIALCIFFAPAVTFLFHLSNKNFRNPSWLASSTGNSFLKRYVFELWHKCFLFTCTE